MEDYASWIDESVQRIKMELLYRGQLLRKRTSVHRATVPDGHVPPKGETGAFESFLLSFAASLELKALFPFQRVIINRILAGHDSCISMVRGSGTRTAIDAATIFQAAYEGKTTIYVTPHDPALIVARIAAVLEQLVEGPLVTLLSSKDVIQNAQASIIIVKATEFRDLIMHDKGVSAPSSALSRVGHVVLEDVHCYQTAEFVHLTEMMKLIRIRRHYSGSSKSALQVTVTTHPIKNPNEVVRVLCNVQSADELTKSVLSLDDSRKNPYVLFYWMPSLETELTSSSGTFGVRRLPYENDLALLLGTLVRQPDVHRILIWRNKQPLSQNERESLSRLINSMKASAPHNGLTGIDICDNIDDLPRDRFRSYQVVLSLSLPLYVEGFHNALGNLFDDGGGIGIVILEEGFQSLQALRSERYSPESTLPSRHTLPGILIADFGGVALSYFLDCIDLLGDDHVLRFLEVERYYPDLKNYIPLLERDCAVSVRVDQEGKPDVLLPGQGLRNVKASSNVRFGMSVPGAIKELKKDTPKGVEILPVEQLQGELFFQEGMRIYVDSGYCSVAEKDDGTHLLPFDGAEHVCYPIVGEVTQSKEPTIIDRAKITVNGVGLNATLQQTDLSIELKGFKSLSHPTLTLRPSVTIHPKTVTISQAAVIRCDIVGLNLPADSKALATLMFQYFSSEFSGLRYSLLILGLSEQILVVPLLGGGRGLAQLILRTFQDLFNYLKEFAYDQFLNCICQDGCPLCVKEPFYLEDIDDASVRKNGVFLWLGTLADKKKETENIIQHRSIAIPAQHIREALHLWQTRIIQLFSERFDMVISKPVQPFAVDHLPENVIGVFTGDSVMIIQTIGDERTLVEVVAHEYAHNWQSTDGKMHPSLLDKNLPFEGKLFVEGFAQWVAFRTMDFYGLLSNMREIQMRGVDWAGDEYGEGFRVCRFIEEKLTGFSGLVRFITTGELRDPETQELLTVEQILERAGTYTRLGSINTNK